MSAPFRFYDNRQKYLAFVGTCTEKTAIARRAGRELAQLHPSPPAVRLFDAGMGDASILAKLMRHAHALHPTVPLLVVAKEISLEDLRLGLDRMPDRFAEHPATVLVLTNLHYADAPRLVPRDAQSAAALNWQEVRLAGHSAHDYSEQIDALAATLEYGWQTRVSPRTGNPVYVRPSVLVIYREDHKFLLDGVIPRPGRIVDNYDLILASQPWRARVPAAFKAQKVLAPLARALSPGGRLVAIQAFGKDPGLEIVQRLWPGEDPFEVGRQQLLAALKSELAKDARDFQLQDLPDDKAVFRYELRTQATEIGDRIGTSTLFAAWNAAIYVAQVDDARLDAVVRGTEYLDVTADVLRRHGGLWFNDETFIVTRRR